MYIYVESTTYRSHIISLYYYYTCSCFHYHQILHVVLLLFLIYFISGYNYPNNYYHCYPYLLFSTLSIPFTNPSPSLLRHMLTTVGVNFILIFGNSLIHTPSLNNSKSTHGIIDWHAALRFRQGL